MRLAEKDYFSDHSILLDPYEYFEALREDGPVVWLAHHSILAVLGYEEALQTLRNSKEFSSVIAPQGPAAPLPFAASPHNMVAQVEEHRSAFFGGELLVSLDGQRHAQSRAILNRLFTPSRLKANAQYVSELADEYVRKVVTAGRCEMVGEVATPFVTAVIADLLGVPPADRRMFMDAIEAGPPPGSLESEHLANQGNAMALRAGYFARYVMTRREAPTDDVLSELANATYPDGSLPEVAEIVRLASFLFGAGQDTSAKLLTNALRYIVDEPGLQDDLRANPGLIPDVLEEVLRLEGSTKMTARLALVDTRIGSVDVPAGTKVFVALAAANRDPRRWDEPQSFVLRRPRIKEHLAFGRDAHVCAGAPLARAEVRIILEKLLEETKAIGLDRDHHGSQGSRTFDFEPSFIIRGLSALHVTFE